VATRRVARLGMAAGGLPRLNRSESLRRLLTNVASATSLLLGVALIGVWVSSYRWQGNIYCEMPVGASMHRTFTIGSTPGRIFLHTVWARFALLGRDAYVRDWNDGTTGIKLRATWVRYKHDGDYPPPNSVYWARWYSFARGTDPPENGKYPQYGGTWIWVADWYVFPLFFVLPFTAQMTKVRSTRRRKAGRCPSCGYDLRASTIRCPECGTPKVP